MEREVYKAHIGRQLLEVPYDHLCEGFGVLNSVEGTSAYNQKVLNRAGRVIAQFEVILEASNKLAGDVLSGTDDAVGNILL